MKREFMASGDGTVIRKTALSILSLAVLLGANVAVVDVAQAFNMGNMMNPSRWFDDDDYYDRGYYGRGYGPYGGYGYGPWGYGGGPYGYGGPWGGYPGYGGYGYGQQPSTIVVNPSPDSSRQQAPAPAPRLPE
jgi:hypothetical protein